MNLDIHNLTAVAVVFIAGYFLPFITSLVSKQHWSGATMGLVTTILSAITGFFGEWASSPDIEHFDWRSALALALGALATSLLSRYLVLIHTELDAKLLAIGSRPAAPAPEHEAA